MIRAAILADGAPPCHPAALAAFAEADELVCCDGAYLKARALGREADFVVGDGDSLPADVRDSLGSRFVRVAEQDTNDLAKAFRFLRARHPGGFALTVLGASGLRDDHALANLFHFADFAREIPHAKLVTDAGTFEAVRAGETRTFSSSVGEPVSVFAPEPDARATSSGLAWPLDGVALSPLWKGASNRSSSSSFTISSTRLLLVYRPHAPCAEEMLNSAKLARALRGAAIGGRITTGFHQQKQGD